MFEAFVARVVCISYLFLPRSGLLGSSWHFDESSAVPELPLRQVPFLYTRLLSSTTAQTNSLARFFSFPSAGTCTPTCFQAEKVITSFQPYADVWSITGAVGPFITATARAPVTTLDPEAVSADHASMKSRCAAPASPLPAAGAEYARRWSWSSAPRDMTHIVDGTPFEHDGFSSFFFCMEKKKGGRNRRSGWCSAR